ERASEGDEVELDQQIEMRSSLFRRDDAPPNQAPNLLVYTLVHGGSERLVTVFDVGDTKVTELLDPPADELGDHVAVRLRYNALVDGVGTQFTGSRHVERTSEAD